MADYIPKRAIDFIKNKNLKTGFSYKDVWHEEHSTGYTVAKAMQYDVLSDLNKASLAAIEEGQSFESFKKNIKPVLQAKGWWGRCVLVVIWALYATPYARDAMRRVRMVFSRLSFPRKRE